VPSPSKLADLKLARQCPDWTERRPNLAGILGVSMCKRYSELGWIVPIRKSRAVRVTLEGKEAFSKYLHIVIGLKISACVIPGKRFPHLLHRPLLSGVFSHLEVQHTTSSV
jgi:hypothetical protein